MAKSSIVSFARAVAVLSSNVGDLPSMEKILTAIGKSVASRFTSESLTKLILETVGTAAREGWLDTLISAALANSMGKSSLSWSEESVRKVLSPTSKTAYAADTAPAGLELYWQAAAVLIEFDPWEIRPVASDQKESSEPQRRNLIPYILADSRLSGDIPQDKERATRMWSLRDKLRRSTLQQLIAGQRIEQALAANPDRPREGAQRLLELALTSKLPPVSEISPSDLSALLRVLNLLQGVVQGLPCAMDVRSRIELENLLAPFGLLTGRHFSGRASELQVLRDYVSVLRTRSTFSAVTTSVMSIVGLYEKPPLMIQGIGGMGKSTLIAKFILEHARETDPARQIPFLYLDLDRPGLCAEEPASLLVEAARQLVLQYPSICGESDSIVQTWLRRLNPASSKELTSDSESGPPLQFSTSPVMTAASVAIVHQHQFIDEFAQLVESAEATDRPILFVLDTFEEVQLRSRDFVDALFDFLDALQRRLPRLRTILVGRNPVPNFRTRRLQLRNFSSVEAKAYLISRGLDETIALQIAKVLPGNPLLLRVTADWVLKLNLADRTTLNFSDLGGLDAEAAQAVLYRRFLEHVKDGQIRKLANPGLILRSITVETISRVLAGACELGSVSESRAAELFEGFRTQLPLIREESGELRLRSDLRRLMVRWLEKDNPELCRKIHLAAVEYYFDRPGAADRAEEIYHRLKLGQDNEILDARWRDDICPLLQNAIEELEPHAKSYLASRVGSYAALDDWSNVQQPEWERYARGRAIDLLRLDRPEDAVELLSSRAFSSESGIPLIYARALVRVGDVTRARDILTAALAAMTPLPLTPPGAKTPDMESNLVRADLLCELAGVEELAGELHEGLNHLLGARMYAQLANDSARTLDICTQVIRLARLVQGDFAADPDVLNNVEQQVADLLKDIHRATPQARLAAAEISQPRPTEALDALRRLGLADPQQVAKADVLWLLTRWDQLAASETGWPPGTIAQRAGVKPLTDSIAESWRKFAAGQSTDALLSIAESILWEAPPSQMPTIVAEFVRRTSASAPGPISVSGDQPPQEGKVQYKQRR
jgi:hypothetical protein